MLHVLFGLGNDLIYYFWKSWFDERVDQLTPQENTERTMTVMSDFQLTQVEEINEKLQYDVK